MDRPILFSAPMVRATLDGRKAQTRRIVDLKRAVGTPECPPGHALDLWYPGATCHYGYQPRVDYAWQVQRLCDDSCQHGDDVGPYDGRHSVSRGPLPFWPGLRLWVRETFALHRIHEPTSPSKVMPTLLNEVWFAADGAKPDGSGRWRPSIHMPRWTSRITLEVTDVRAERLQDISEDDAEAEGIERGDDFFQCPTWKNYQPDDEAASWFPDDPVGSFRTLWDSINGKRPGCAWDDNPWVWVVEFKRLEAQS